MVRKAVPKKNQRVKPIKPLTLSPAATRVATLGSVVLIVVGAILWLFAWLGNPDNLKIQQVEWLGDFRYLKKAELEQAAQVFLNTNLYLLNAGDLEKTLEENPWVRDIGLRKVWPNHLIISVEAQVPIAFWGNEQLLNQYGEVFSGNLPEKQGIFPLIYSPLVNGRQMGERYVQLMQVFQGLNLEIAELTEDEKGSWALRFRQGPAVVIGRKEQTKRMQRLKVAYLKELNKTFDQIESIDLRYTNGFAVEWKQGFRSADARDRALGHTSGSLGS